MPKTRHQNSFNSKNAQQDSTLKFSAAQTDAACTGISLIIWIELLMCLVNKAKGVTKKNSHSRIPSMIMTKTAQVTFPITHTESEFITTFSHQAELDELRQFVTRFRQQNVFHPDYTVSVDNRFRPSQPC